jgi:hypothetical protein
MAMETWSPSALSVGRMFSGQSTKPSGEGWTITGYKPEKIAMNPNRMGSGFRTVQVPIYSRMPAPVQQEPVQEEAPVQKQEQTELETKPREEPKTSPMQDVASQIASSISDMQSGFQQQLQQQAAQFAAIQKAQEERMIALQEQMKQSAAAAAAANRPTVAGVKTATGSAGTDMQIARRGVRGAFGRTGMRIQSLNV